MKGIKRFLCCVSYSLISSNGLLAAPEVSSKVSTLFSTAATQMVHASAPVRRMRTVLISNTFLNVNKRFYTTFGGSETGKYSELVKQTESLLEILRQQTQILIEESNSRKSEQSTVVLKAAQITPVNFSKTSQFGEEAASIAHVQNRMSEPDSSYDQTSLSIVEKKREELLNRLMECVKVDNKITRADITKIVDLYGALANRQIGGITKVLTGQVDTPKSGSYSNVTKYLSSKGTTIDILRDIYKRLSTAFGEDVDVVLLRVIEEIMEQNDYKIKLFRQDLSAKMSRKDVIDYITKSANPLYAVHIHEVKAILDLYDALLKTRPLDGITKVLTGQVDTPKSGIYSNVVKYMNANQLDLKSFRYMYNRLNKATDENFSQIIMIIMNKS